MTAGDPFTLLANDAISLLCHSHQDFGEWVQGFHKLALKKNVYLKGHSDAVGRNPGNQGIQKSRNLNEVR